MDREGPPRKPVQPRHHRPKPEGDQENRELLHIKASREEQPGGVVTARENLTAPLELTVSQCEWARIWTAGTVKPSNRGAEEIQYLRHNNPGRRIRTNHAQLWSERLETKDVEYASKSRRGKGQEEERWPGKKPLNRRPKGMHRFRVKPWGMRMTTPGGERNTAGSTGIEKFLRNIEISTIQRANQVLQGQDRVKGWLRAQNWRLTHHATTEDNW